MCAVNWPDWGEGGKKIPLDPLSFEKTIAKKLR